MNQETNKQKKSSFVRVSIPVYGLRKTHPMVITVVCAFCEGNNCGNWVASCQVQILLWRKFEPSVYPILQ